MGQGSYLWLKAGHLLGVVGWLGGMLAVISALGAGNAPGGKRVAMVMDLGATLAIGAGLALLLGLEPSPLTRPNFHIKLTVVIVGLLGLHGFLRVRLGKVSRGAAEGVPGFVLPLWIALVAALFVIVYPLSTMGAD